MHFSHIKTVYVRPCQRVMDCIVLFSKEEKGGGGGMLERREEKKEGKKEWEKEETEWCGAAVKDMAA